MSRILLTLTLLLSLTSVSGCYRTVRAGGAYGARTTARPDPLQSGTYWTAEGSSTLDGTAEGSATGVVVADASASGSVDASGGVITPAAPASYGGGVASGAASSSDVTLAGSSAGGGPVAGTWSAGGGWLVAAPAAGEARFGADVTLAVPTLAVELSGGGTRLSAIAGVGITIDCDGCGLDGEIAALSRLGPLGDGALSGSARVGGDAHVIIEAALAHEGLPAAGGASEVVVRVRGGEAPDVAPPLRIHLVIDASTSMETRWTSVKNAAVALIGTLRPEDELQIVVYGDGARIALPSRRVGDGSRARSVVRGLRVGGRTNIEAGLRAAYGDVSPDGGSVVVLLSDGVPQGGAATPAELSRLAADAYAAEATTTVAIGLGVEFHAGILRAVATEGHGDFRIAPRVSELPALLEAEIRAHGQVVAREVAVNFTLGEGVQITEGASLPSGVTIVDGGARVMVPAVSAGAELTFALPVTVGRAAVGGTVASVHAGWTSAAGTGHGDKDLRVARASGPVPSGSMRASLDLELKTVLELAAVALENGEAERAAAFLDAHAVEVEGVLAVHVDARLRERATASRALAYTLRTMVPEASWPERRSAAAAMLEWSVHLGR